MFNYRDVLDSDGLIARRRQGYERRDAQLAMAAEVDSAIRHRRLLAVEAGTGVGKSFAYLVPAILYVVEDQVRNYSAESRDGETAYGSDPSSNDATDAIPLASDSDETRVLSFDAARLDREAPPRTSKFGLNSVDDGFLRGEEADGLRRVVISTHTISLQEQLFEKDIPFLNSILPFEFAVALAKGRANYVCLRRFENAVKGEASGTLFETDRQTELKRLKEWIETTVDGSKSELSPLPPSDVWNEICCEQGNCLGKKCKRRDQCFYARARRRLRNAQLIVVNHALLFSDLALRGDGGAILPNYDVLIFDEAHTMEQVAAEHMGVELTQYAVDYLLTRLYNDRTNKGLLVEECEKMFGAARELFVAAAKLVDECRYRAEEFFADLNDWLEERPGSNGRVFEKNIVKNGLSEGLSSLKNALRHAADALEDDDRRQEYVAARDRVESFIEAIDDWLEQRAEGFVYWLERTSSARGQRIVMRAAPIDVAPILRAKLFNVIPTVVAASATLTTRAATKKQAGLRRATSSSSTPGSSPVETSIEAIATEPEKETPELRRAFEFFRRRVGMTGARARALGSPFDYRRQMTLVLAKNLELREVGSFGGDAFSSTLAEENERRLWAALRGYVEETDGGVFVLFTNASQMKRATEALESFFAQGNYPFFSQSDGAPRQRMVQMFKESSRSVLFGVDSFWQGVDVPGAALRNVVIVKFPFLAPERPLVEARLEAIRKQGGVPFRDYLLPTAILKFKQGVGRLIRTKNDVGQVVVLDERIHTKSYGREFLRALPDCKLRVDVFQ